MLYPTLWNRSTVINNLLTMTLRLMTTNLKIYGVRGERILVCSPFEIWEAGPSGSMMHQVITILKLQT